MASEVNRLFGCPVCGCRIGSGETVCPRCGHKFSPRTKFECPFCGELVEQGLGACSACGVNFTDFSAKVRKDAKADGVDEILEDLLRLETLASLHDEISLACPGCGAALEGTEDACPKCGKRLSAEVSAICPACGAVVPEDAKSCPDCGASFSEEQAPAEEEKPEKRPRTAEEVDSVLEAIEQALMRKSAPEPAAKPAEQGAPPPTASKLPPAKEVEHVPLVFTKKIITIQPPPSASDEEGEGGPGPQSGPTAASEPPRRKLRKVKSKPKAR